MKTHALASILFSTILTAGTVLVLSVACHLPDPTPAPSPSDPSSSHAVVPGKELFILAEPVRALGQAGAPDPIARPLQFRAVMQRLAGSADVNAFVEDWAATWERQTQVNGSAEIFTTRPSTAAEFRRAWRDNSVRLLGVVNRLDLTRFRDNDPAQAVTELGEGRLIYEFLAASGRPMTVILEFGLEARATAGSNPDFRPQFQAWGKRWHRLGDATFGGPTEFSPAYLSELLSVIGEYAVPQKLRQVRTNEFIEGPWQLREFHLDRARGRLVQVPVALTPSAAAGVSPSFGQFVSAHADAIRTGTPVSQLAVTRDGNGTVTANEWDAFQGAVADANPDFTWPIPTTPRDARFIVSFNTCNGCHTGDTRDTASGESTLFQHLGARAPSGSAFVNREITLADVLPGDSSARHDEMNARAGILAAAAQDQPELSSLGVNQKVLQSIVSSRAMRVH